MWHVKHLPRLPKATVGLTRAPHSWGNIGIMENQMETTIVYWGLIWKGEKKQEGNIVM